jgi:hypothetical protein
LTSQKFGLLGFADFHLQRLGSSQKQTNLVLFSGSRDLERVLYGKKQQNLQNVTMNISLTGSLEQWLQKKVASGRYQTSSECAAVG